MINKVFELIQQGEFQQAEKILHNELESNPDNMPARVALAMAQLGQSNFTEVEHTLLPVLNVDPLNAQALVFMGAALLEQGRFNDSIKYLQRVTRRHSDNVQAQFCLARAFLADGKAPFAEPCLQKAIKVEPDNAELWGWLGRVQLKLNRIDDAKQSFDRARPMDHNDVGMLKDFARVETIQGNMDEAIALNTKAVELAPEDYQLAFDFADMLIEQERYELASEQLERLRLAGFETDKVSALLANSYAKQGQHTEALSLLSDLQRTPVIQPAVRLLISLALRLCGRPDNADEHLDILLEMNPPWPDAVLIRANQYYAANDKKGIDMLADFLKRRDINSWQIQQAKTLMAFALERAGYEPINAPQRQQEEVFAEASPDLGEELIPGFNPAEIAPLPLPEQPEKVAYGELAVSAMESKTTKSWPKQPPDDGERQPVFVFAWPGSGREQLLGSLAQNAGLIYMPDDEDSQASRRARLTDRLGANDLGDLNAAQIARSRRLYWRSASGGAGLPEHMVAVDLQILGAEMLPTIARYFPAAPIIVLTRDPRDMAVFWKKANHPDLENFATLYQSQLQQLKLCRQNLPLTFIDVDFDGLCADPEPELEKIQRAIGVEPEEQVVNKFQHTIAEFPPNAGGWKDYQTEMAPIFDKFS